MLQLLSTATRRGFTTQSSGKSVLVTGGASGIGEAICRHLSKDGYAVFIADINSVAGEGLAKELAGSTFLEVDVTVPEQVEGAVLRIAKEHGALDGLVNNAGVVGPQAPFGDYDLDEWKRVLDVNLNGTFYGLKYGLTQMAKQGNGSIVNMSSTAGFRGICNLGPYTASKFAARGLTQAAAVEYGGKNIRVNSVAPAACETEMVNSFIGSSPNPDAMRDLITANYAMDGFVQPGDVAAAVAFLLSNDARFITGHTIPVDAGALSRIANQREMTNVK
mmetsp:Transcript_14594/g.25714  ORF Transcript_14594/g.25714 Transcript_14594/m.25714 type:complete len:276 (+) Transcript_14594:70-897(+)|eukprot:CAMPEP_0202012096 /NCGR_PEP_ID=MMETSP0905-20130828/22290_1 /ASSEMBLY_ACC=CAM_ASM_000554 /TAXON_ID=420261 /ORGANISM="Thalassiosira antarctica, Strain CCMP982" /LENGTH=275 /DNA_ID=CAMNT_0048571217 /DNA_START=44 /DNA_END=871 /DNA_ORIENTATION=-